MQAEMYEFHDIYVDSLLCVFCVGAEGSEDSKLDASVCTLIAVPLSDV